MNKIERYCQCETCKGTGKVWDELDQDYKPIYGTCWNCHGEGTIDNPEYWSGILPKKPQFKEGSEVLLEYYNQKRNG